jgi:hypothetical protein
MKAFVLLFKHLIVSYLTKIDKLLLKNKFLTLKTRAHISILSITLSILVSSFISAGLGKKSRTISSTGIVLATFFKAEPHAIGDNLLEIVPRRSAVTNNSEIEYSKNNLKIINLCLLRRRRYHGWTAM